MNTKTLKLNTPIVRGDKAISQIEIRKPNVSAIRGISLGALLNMHVDAVAEVIPRICEPILAPYEVSQMDCIDILQAGILIASFFIPAAELETME